MRRNRQPPHPYGPRPNDRSRQISPLCSHITHSESGSALPHLAHGPPPDPPAASASLALLFGSLLTRPSTLLSSALLLFPSILARCSALRGDDCDRALSRRSLASLRLSAILARCAGVSDEGGGGRDPAAGCFLVLCGVTAGAFGEAGPGPAAADSWLRRAELASDDDGSSLTSGLAGRLVLAA